jgi:hypothetical protein
MRGELFNLPHLAGWEGWLAPAPYFILQFGIIQFTTETHRKLKQKRRGINCASPFRFRAILRLPFFARLFPDDAL